MPRVDSGEADKGSAAPQPPPASPSVQPADKGPPPEQADWGVLRLPSAVDDVCVGGGGRFLFLRLPHEHKVAVFDANEAKIVKYLPLAEDGGVFTAGREELIVALPLSNVLQRWSLATFEKEATVASPMRGALADVVMGSSSDGPLLICANGGGTFVDARTFRPIELKWTEEHMPGVAPGLVRASADGSVFGMRNDVGAEGHSVSVIAVHGDEARSHTKSILPSLLLPDFDGRYVYTKESVLNSQLGTTALPLGGGIPAHTGPFCLCEAGGRPNGAPDGAADQTTGTLSLYLPDQPGPLYVFRGVRGVVPEDLNYGGQGKGRLHYDKRIHLLPDAKLLVTIPPTNDCLLLHRFDLDELLAHSGLDYLFVASHPPASVNRGTVFTYPIVVKSRKGGVTRKLEYGPKGMTLTPDGVLRWDVPADFPDAEADVLTTIGDASGREAFQTFKLSIVGKITEAAATPTEKTPGPNDKPPSSSPPGPTLADEGFTAVKTTPPAASATGLKPAPLQEERMELRLSSAADDVCVGGGGRFLILRLPKEHKLAVFDANEAKIVKYLPLAEDDALIAAGLDKLIVALPAGNILERWSLTTFEREVRVPSPVDGAIKRLLMGSATRGPLVVGAPAEKDGLKFLDPLTFQDAGISVVPGKGGGGVGHFSDAASETRISANGDVITRWTISGSPIGLTALVRDGKTFKQYSQNLWVGASFPSADGRFFLTDEGVFSLQTGELHKHEHGHANGVWTVPAAEGAYFLVFTQSGDGAAGDGCILRVSIHQGDESRPLASLPGSKEYDKMVDWQTGQVKPLDRHFFLIQDADLLVFLPAANDRIVLQRFNLERILDKAGVDYLYLANPSAARAVRGAAYTYPLVVKSKRGGAGVRIDSGPDGMKVESDGKIVWQVPKDFPDADVVVILTVKDASGQEQRHSFRVEVGGPKESGPTSPPH